jgi:hypothetical protein
MNTDFSWKRAVFAGFGVLRREPGALLTWIVVAVVFGLADHLLDARSQALADAGRAGARVLADLFRGAITAAGMSVLAAAVYRAVLRPGGERRGRTRFGRDEIRLTLLLMFQGAALVAVLLVALVPLALVSPRQYGYNDAAYGVVLVVVLLLVLIAWGWLLARLSLVGPMTVEQGRWSGSAAWCLTRGRVRKIARVHLVVMIGLAVVFAVWSVLYGMAATAMVPGFSPRALMADPTLADLSKPVWLVFVLLSAGLGAVAAPIFYAPAAAIYRELNGDPVSDQIAVFD